MDKTKENFNWNFKMTFEESLEESIFWFMKNEYLYIKE